MSPRAACRLATLGFQRVHDYVPGKADWLARGLPTEGEKAGEPRAGAHAQHDVVVAGLDERVGAIAERVRRSPYGFALVVGPGHVLMGRLRRAALEGDPDAGVDDVMEPGPSTVRADVPLGALEDRMRERDLTSIVVTDPDGVLVGVVPRGSPRRTRRGDPPA